MRIVALDLVRFFAALSVVLYHYISRKESTAYPLISNLTDYGYLGVPLFFIISGYVIALSANNRTPLQFAISRFFRLYPALWAGVVFTVVVSVMLTDTRYSLAQILSNFTLLNDYIGFEDVDGVYWTLKAELKFYACVLLLLAFGIFQKFNIWLSGWLFLAVLHFVSGQPFFMGWFISPSYSPFFIAGVALFLIQNNGQNPFNIFILLASLILSSLNAYNQADAFMSNPDIGEKLISVALVWFFYGFMYFLSLGRINLKKRNIFVTMGALTYPLYLIHNVAGKAIIDEYSATIPESVMIPIVIALMIAVSWLIHVIVEKSFSTPLKNYTLSVLSRVRSLKNRSGPPPSSAAD